ncbi:hypothetical protein BpHYR1_029941 [Brachionus plicatilis]|uniref:Uncharacterized protein n=1 Tax=Brachionus plicatilis TaxID=10195 RepID=A0A3M7QLS2_BRAPC|nr:hypothetical protein BpHYR1_029941 [Brachionus plicatilis]
MKNIKDVKLHMAKLARLVMSANIFVQSFKTNNLRVSRNKFIKLLSLTSGVFSNGFKFTFKFAYLSNQLNPAATTTTNINKQFYLLPFSETLGTVRYSKHTHYKFSLLFPSSQLCSFFNPQKYKALFHSDSHLRHIYPNKNLI